MTVINSERAQKVLNEPKFFVKSKGPEMKKYPGTGPDLWVEIIWEGNLVKNLSFFGEQKEATTVLMESMANLLINKPITKIKEITLRECEAFLRDKNSVKSVDEIPESEEENIGRVFQWMGSLSPLSPPKDYDFSSSKGPFERLKLVDKIREVKAFLNSPPIAELYQNLTRPELVDVEDLTVYIHAPYESSREKALFGKLHELGVETFREENLNFIPEGP